MELELGVPARRCGLHARKRGRTPQSLQGRSQENHHPEPPLSLSPDAPLRPKAPGKQRAVEHVEAHTGQPPGMQSKGGDGVKGRSWSQLIQGRAGEFKVSVWFPFTEILRADFFT